MIFKLLHEDDLELMYKWFQTPHVNKWYARGNQWSLKDIEQKYLPRIKGEDDCPSFIVYHDKKPIGFIQYYSLENSLPEGVNDYKHPIFLEFKPSELAGVDLFIGSVNCLGKGIGTKMLRKFLKEHVFTKFKAVAIDPESDNLDAIRCYEKAGFELSTKERSNDGKSISLMLLSNN